MYAVRILAITSPEIMLVSPLQCCLRGVSYRLHLGTNSRGRSKLGSEVGTLSPDARSHASHAISKYFRGSRQWALGTYREVRS